MKTKKMGHEFNVFGALGLMVFMRVEIFLQKDE